MKIDKFKINKKRDELNTLIEENSLNLLSDKILRVSQELDNLIYKYLLAKDTYKN